MKLVRFQVQGRTAYGILQGDELRNWRVTSSAP